MAKEIAIIGAGVAGVAGLALALCLEAEGFNCAVYESRDAPLNIGGAVMLSPNALKILDNLGIYKKIESQSFGFDTLYFRNVAGELQDTYEFGSTEKYGYGGLRPYRYQLIDVLLDKIRAKNISLHFGRKFSHIVEETETEVTWQFTDGSTSTASMLVGADGIHSKVRSYLFPDLEPKFIGLTGITAAVPTSQLRLPSPDYQLPVTITKPGMGAFVIAPQGPDGSEVFFGRLRRMSEQTRQEWDEIHADKEASIAFLKEGASAFGDLAVSATEHIPAEKINVWPFYVIPKLTSWTSERKRVVLVGDGAHAIPPSSVRVSIKRLRMSLCSRCSWARVKMERRICSFGKPSASRE